jgi:hypothetical protein
MYTLSTIGGKTNALTVDASSNVGIGTTVPQEKLHIQGNIKSSNNIENGGMDFKLGTRDQATRGNSGNSRALVKDAAATLVVNYANDFIGGTRVDGNLSVTGSLKSFLPYYSANVKNYGVLNKQGDVAFDQNVVTNVSAWYNTTSGVFTPLTAGIYYISANGACDGSSYMYVMKNGTVIASGLGQVAIGTGWAYKQVMCLVSMNGTTDSLKINVSGPNGIHASGALPPSSLIIYMLTST